jgi:hypothetical protein
VSGVLVLGGRPLPHARDDIRRYCGLSWSGAGLTISAFHYYDVLEERREDDVVRPIDVLSTAALHPGLRFDDLRYFAMEVDALSDFLAGVPAGVDLADADDELVNIVSSIPLALPRHPRLSVLSKVLHAKRPRLIPILDRSLTDWYRHLTGGRGAEAWSSCVRELRSDLAEPANREFLRSIRAELDTELSVRTPSELRLADMAIWVSARGFSATGAASPEEDPERHGT